MKDTAVKTMFETIAAGYDFQNSFLSLGQDIYWRRVLAAALELPPGGRIVDVAAGTGETALAINRRHPRNLLVGVDFSPAMLAVGRRKIAARRPGAPIGLTGGDGRQLPLRSGVADAVTIAFGIRNIEERYQALAEFHRVLKPGGRLYVMEFSYPEAPVLAPLYRFYFHHILPPVGNRISKTDYAYSYLADSVRNFPDDRQFCVELKHAGFIDPEIVRLTFGIVKIFISRKEEA